MSRLFGRTIVSAPNDSLLGRLADEYADALARGEEISIDQLAAEYPEQADVIREMFPAILALRRTARSDDGGLPGDDLGDFHLLREVGRGGMGIVYEAEQISLARRVALKTLPLTAVLDPKQLARFRVEAQAAASLEHPNIVSVYAVGSDRGVQYYAMRYIDGQSLAEVISAIRTGDSLETDQNRVGSIAATLGTLHSTDARQYFRRVAKLGREAAEALHYAHEMGIVHRDVKPSNLLVDQDGQLFVTDFGLALIQGNAELTMTGDLIGTLRYMSPEQASGQRALVDRRTDVYALGASLYELATLRPAFPEEDRALLLRLIVEDNPPRPSRIAPNVPRDLETILLKALAKEPTNRYNTAHELEDDLARFIRNEPIQARPVTRFESMRSWCRRNKLVAGLLIAVILLLSILAIGGPLVAVKQTQLVREARRELNAKNITQLYQDWYSGNAERVGNELAKHYAAVDPTESLFEWELLRRIYEDSRENIIYEKRNANTLPQFLAFSPDGRCLAAGQPDDHLGLYDLERKTWRLLENDPSGGAAAVAYTSDGRQLVTASWTAVVNRRDVNTGQVVGPTIDCGAGETKEGDLMSWNQTIQISPDDRTVAVGLQTGTLALANLTTGAVSRVAAHDSCLISVAFSPDGSTLVSTAFDKSVKSWKIDHGQLLPASSIPLTSNILSFDFANQKGRLITADKRGTHVLDVPTLSEFHTLPPLAPTARKVAVFRNKVLAAADRNGQITIWDMNSETKLLTLFGNEGRVENMVFSPVEATLASYSSDGTLRLWNLREKLSKASDIAHSSRLWDTRLQFVEEGRRLNSFTRPRPLTAGDTATTFARQWDVAARQDCSLVEPGIFGRSDVAIVSAEDCLLCGEPGRLSLREIRSGKLIQTLDENLLHEYQHVTLSPDGCWAVGVGNSLTHPRHKERLAEIPDGKTCFVAMHNLRSKKQQFFPLRLESSLADGWIIRTLAFSPDGKYLITAGGDGIVFSRLDVFERVRDEFRHVKAEEILMRGKIGAILDIAFSVDCRLIGVVTDCGYGKIWSLQEHVREKEFQRQGGIYALAFSPDGRVVALANQSGIQLCDLETMFPLATITLGSTVCDLQFTPDGNTLAWATQDGRVDFLSTEFDSPQLSLSSASNSR